MLADRRKTFETRINDRQGGFNVGDTLVLREYDRATQIYTDKPPLIAQVTSLLDDPELCKTGFVTMSIRVFDWWESPRRHSLHDRINQDGSGRYIAPALLEELQSMEAELMSRRADDSRPGFVVPESQAPVYERGSVEL
jgi:hypothetical protein